MRIAGLAGWSGAGKTTLMTRVIPLLRGQGLTVSTIKHAHHDFDMDQPGKDSWRHREAGATEVLVISAQRWVLQHELRGVAEPSLEALIARMAPVDLLLIEGFKRHPHPKLEIHQPALEKPLLYPDDADVRGVAVVGGVDGDDWIDRGLPVLDADDIGAVAAFLMNIAMPYTTI